MIEKEKLELKIGILEDILECMSFNFGSINYTLDKSKLEETIASYVQVWSDLYENNVKN